MIFLLHLPIPIGIQSGGNEILDILHVLRIHFLLRKIWRNSTTCLSRVLDCNYISLVPMHLLSILRSAA
jgi:hypothetical protein